MLVTSDYFVAYTTNRLEPQDKDLPICQQGRVDLLSMLKNHDDYTYLTIRSDNAMETVRVSNLYGELVLERGVEGTKAVLHHTGSCVSSVSPTVIAMIKDLICNWSCCDGEPCPCTEAKLVGITVVSDGQVGKDYKAVITFDGTLPMNISFGGLPAWANAYQTNNTAVVTGVPDKAGETRVVMAVTNCDGSNTYMDDSFLIRVKD